MKELIDVFASKWLDLLIMAVAVTAYLITKYVTKKKGDKK
jgi:hypothetical protein